MVSHFASGTPAYASHFLERNQLIAGFARATWVVEAAEVSGTLNTAMWAARMDRDIYATSCFPNDPFFQGNEKLLSHRHPHRYPIAQPLFGAHSFSASWSFLGEDRQSSLPKISNRLSQLQVWTQQLLSELGSC